MIATPPLPFQHIDLTSVTADSRMSEDSVKDGSTGVGSYSLGVNNGTSADAGIYACIAIASFVDLDKTIKFRTARVTVRESGGEVVRQKMLVLYFFMCVY